jgi:hypothetical protein
MSSCAGSRVFWVVFPEMQRNLVHCALFPLFRLCQPEMPVMGVNHRTLSANKFLITDFDESIHELHSLGVKLTLAREISGVPA